MGLREGIAERLFGDIFERRLSEAVASDAGWRSLSSVGQRDTGFGTHAGNLIDSLEAYRSNPLAHRLIELTTDFVLGKGLRLVANDTRAQRFLDDFWRCPLNHMETRQFELCSELSLSGELFITFHTNAYDGMTAIRAIPAQEIDEIETNGEDLEDELRFHQLRRASITPATDFEGRWWSKEDCRHFAINRLVGTTRGQGDLVPLLPWLRRYKDWLTDRVRINRFKGSFLWDVTVRGANRQALLARQADLSAPPEPGSVIVHNEGEEWKAAQPHIDAQAVEPDGRAMRLMIAAGAGIPLHFLGEGEGANRSTAAEMGPPTYRHFERRQLYFGQVMREIAMEVLRRSGRFPRAVEISVEFDDITAQDNLASAQALEMTLRALGQAVRDGLMDRDEARQTFARLHM